MWNQLIGQVKPVSMLLAVSGLAWVLGGHWPVLGAPLLAMLFGAVLAPWSMQMGFTSWFKAGARKLLLASVVVLGFEMDFAKIVEVGKGVAGFMVATVLFALVSSWLFARILRLRGNAAILVGVGTSICGGSAIMAVAGVTRAREDEVVQAMSTIFLFNILAAVLFPLAGHVLGLDQLSFGLWAGTAINDTSSVLAAAFSYGGDAGHFGMVVKLTRTLMILPVSLGLAGLMRYQGKIADHWNRVVPWPVIGFTLAAAVHLFIGNSHAVLWQGTAIAGRILMVLALTSIGLITHLGEIWRKGRRVAAAGALTWGALSMFSLILVKTVFKG